ncbi:hypothetical protein FLK61_39580 [Paenalkalicoccus suaedae]|uniref:Rpn family recombination-promoting nuclease/putative transposase n=1 Tax=Paenalkalicoccus suaedae TaxID=2592382 RepID=A0A859FHV8_9BACI|nr:hypothetical protein [Paenalkalicoccus suaedae]QKS72717.1 hypothetical protein FLK61_39580 [Paenalkalicoccus suaedae]
MEKGRNISRNNYDIFFRQSLQEVFTEEVLKSIGIQSAPIVRSLPTDFPAVETTDQEIDVLFELENHTLLHIEFQTVASSQADLVRFLEYSIKAFKRFNKPCETYVVYGAGVKHAKSELSYSVLSSFYVKNIYLANMDGDRLFKELEEQIVAGAPLTKKQEMELSMLPLMDSVYARRERSLRAANLALEISNKDQQARLVASLLVVTNKFLDDDDADFYKRRLGDMKVIKLVEEEAETRRTEEIAKKMLLNKEAPEKVAFYTNLSFERVIELQKSLG